MAVAFLRDLGVEVPNDDRSELTSCDLGHVDPVERRSDVAIMLRGKVGDDPFGNLMGVVVKVQRDEKERKRFTWPESPRAEGKTKRMAKTALWVLDKRRISQGPPRRDHERIDAWSGTVPEVDNTGGLFGG